MKKLNHTIPVFLILFLISPAYGFAGMNTNASSPQPDPNSITQSDREIVVLQHLIELDAVQMQSENKLLVRETLIFKNIGTKNFSGFLRTWVPDGVSEIRIARIEMAMGAAPRNVPAVQNGNIISWQDFIETNNPLPPLYAVEYLVPSEPEGTLTRTKHYSKTLIFPTLINKQPENIVLKVTRNEGERIAITDENDNSIADSGNLREEGNSVLYGWEIPEFKEINIEISKPAVTPAGIAVYVVIGLLIVLVLSYLVIRKKSGIDEMGDETIEEIASESVEEGVSVEDTEFEGKTRDELENQKTGMLSKIGELDKEYESGNLLDEEYEELRKSYREKIEKISKLLSG